MLYGGKELKSDNIALKCWITKHTQQVVTTTYSVPCNGRCSDLLSPDEVEESGAPLKPNRGQPAVTGVCTQQPRSLGRAKSGCMHFRCGFVWLTIRSHEIELRLQFNLISMKTSLHTCTPTHTHTHTHTRHHHVSSYCPFFP